MCLSVCIQGGLHEGPVWVWELLSSSTVYTLENRADRDRGRWWKPILPPRHKLAPRMLAVHAFPDRWRNVPRPTPFACWPHAGAAERRHIQFPFSIYYSHPDAEASLVGIDLFNSEICPRCLVYFSAICVNFLVRCHILCENKWLTSF